MTDKEFRKLNRKELLELLLAQSKEVERLKELLRRAKEQLDNRTLILEEAGSIAVAAVKVNKVFEDAQKAAEQYLWSVKALAARQNPNEVEIINAARQRCAAMYEETRVKCSEMIEQAKREAESIRGQDME